MDDADEPSGTDGDVGTDEDPDPDSDSKQDPYPDSDSKPDRDSGSDSKPDSGSDPKPDSGSDPKPDSGSDSKPDRDRSAEGDAAVRVRPYDPGRDAAGLWARKRGFETGLGEGTGDEGKADRYAAKLTPSYRERWLAWAERCVAEDADCLQVAVVTDGSDAADGPGDPGGSRDSDGPDDPEGSGAADAAGRDDGTVDGLVGYVFVLPESLAFVWDAAVLNELYVAPAWRGTGVADALMRAALACAREQDLPLDRLVLDVDRANERARAFYDRFGFEHWGEMIAREL